MKLAPGFASLLAISRLFTLASWVVIATLYFFTATLLKLPHRQRIPLWFHRGCCRILPLDITITGELSSHRPTLYLSNHVSYLDIFILGSIVPGCFIAKSEVAGWPLLGRLARLQNTLFFERNAKHARNQIAVMNHHLNTAGNLILFPEGTSTAGITVAPFKSSLLHAAQTAANVAIQPVTIAYTHYQGARMNQASRDYFAWYSDMPFLSHFMRMTGMSRGSVQVIFHPPVQLQQFSSRKSCAEYCRRQVGDALKQALNNAPATPEKPIPSVDKGLSSS